MIVSYNPCQLRILLEYYAISHSLVAKIANEANKENARCFL